MRPERILALTLEKLLGGSPQGAWPLRDEVAVRRQILRWVAHFEGDRQQLAELAGWRHSERPYKLDPLPAKISEGWADLLFGTDPQIEPASKQDEKALEALVEACEFPSECRRGEEVCSSEGEVWWRIFVDRELADYPLIGFHSRLDVIPLYVRRQLLSASFVHLLERSTRTRVYRLFEIHVPGSVHNVLYRGSAARLGEQVPLSEGGEETARVAPVWQHDCPGLIVGRIPNKLGREPRLGISDYARIEDELFSLNEAMTIGHENMRLTAKKRLAVDADQIDAVRSTWDAGEDVIPVGSDERVISQPTIMPMTLEYSFDAAPLIEWRRELLDVALTRIGLTPQWLGVPAGPEGQAESGTALRVRLIPTTTAGKGRGRYWDVAQPRMLLYSQLLDAAPEPRLGFERRWATPGTAPSVERKDPIPPDPVEETAQDEVLVSTGLESRRTIRERRHKEWSEERHTLEEERVRKERDNDRPEFGLGALGAQLRPPEEGSDLPPETG